MKNIFRFKHGTLAFARTSFCISACVMLFAISAQARTVAPVNATTNEDNLAVSSADSLSDQDMTTNRGSGGTTNITTVTSDQTINATSSGNTLNVGGNLTNGSITIGNNFGGSGFGSYVLNSGNNSVINSGVSLSVLMMQ